jgi:hypothetical protein
MQEITKCILLYDWQRLHLPANTYQVGCNWPRTSHIQIRPMITKVIERMWNEYILIIHAKRRRIQAGDETRSLTTELVEYISNMR